MAPSKNAQSRKQWSLGFIVVFMLVAVAFVWFRTNPPNYGVFVLDSSLELESMALDSSVGKLKPSYFTIPNPTPSAHASTIIALEHLSLPKNLRDSYAFMALFFAGSREGARDVGIYQSLFAKDLACSDKSAILHAHYNHTPPCDHSYNIASLKTNRHPFAQADASLANEQSGNNDFLPLHKAQSTLETSKWSEPREILTPALLSHLSGKFIAKLGNPVSFVDSNGRVHLFVVGVSLGGWATSRVYWLEFDETLENLHFRQELALSPFANLSFLVRSSALLLEDGGFILPLYHELARKYPLFLHFDPSLKIHAITKPLPPLGAKAHSKLQPSFAPLSTTKAIGVYRSYTPSPMQVSLCELAPFSHKNMQCHPSKPSNLINYNSSSVLFSTNGVVFLLHNTPPKSLHTPH